jgi:hypothetical protein
VDVLSNGQAVFGIAVGRVWADTEGDLAHLPGEAPAGGTAPADTGPADAGPTVAEAAGAEAAGAEAAGGVPPRAAPQGTQG